MEKGGQLIDTIDMSPEQILQRALNEFSIENLDKVGNAMSKISFKNEEPQWERMIDFVNNDFQEIEGMSEDEISEAFVSTGKWNHNEVAGGPLLDQLDLAIERYKDMMNNFTEEYNKFRFKYKQADHLLSKLPKRVRGQNYNDLYKLTNILKSQDSTNLNADTLLKEIKKLTQEQVEELTEKWNRKKESVLENKPTIEEMMRRIDLQHKKEKEEKRKIDIIKHVVTRKIAKYTNGNGNGNINFGKSDKIKQMINNYQITNGVDYQKNYCFKDKVHYEPDKIKTTLSEKKLYGTIIKRKINPHPYIWHPDTYKNDEKRTKDFADPHFKRTIQEKFSENLARKKFGLELEKGAYKIDENRGVISVMGY